MLRKGPERHRRAHAHQSQIEQARANNRLGLPVDAPVIGSIARLSEQKGHRYLLDAAAARYISSSSYKGKVAVTGLGLPNQMREYVKDDTVKKFALWNPADLGYLAAYAGAAA